MRGKLVDYATLDHGQVFAVRNTSHGHNGENCEVLYVTSVERLRPAPASVWRLLMPLGIVMAALGALGWLAGPPDYSAA
jgi:hypothetical protein